jgi:2-aminoadipate transaminase
MNNLLTPEPTLVLAEWTHHIRRSALRQLVAVVAQPGITSLAGGLPDPALFPAAEYAAALSEVIARDPQSLQYRPPLRRLQEHIVDMMAIRGVRCAPEEIFITTGAQQALQVLAQLLLDPGGQVMIEKTIYSGMRQVLTSLNPQLIGVDSDLREGLDIEGAAAALTAGARPAFLYTIPTGHNPLGVTMSAERRRRLVALAGAYGVPLIEDDPYGFLQYDGEPIRPLRALDDAWVLYVGSFSKILAPALRLGWIVAPPVLVEKLTVIKESIDLETSALTQRAVAAYLDTGHLPQQIARLQDTYRLRRDALLGALARHMPADVRWTRPDAGMFVWVELDASADTWLLLDRAVAEKQVAFVPGGAFALHGEDNGARNCLRLSFASSTPEQIEHAVAAIASLL